MLGLDTVLTTALATVSGRVISKIDVEESDTAAQVVVKFLRIARGGADPAETAATVVPRPLSTGRAGDETVETAAMVVVSLRSFSSPKGIGVQFTADVFLIN